MFNDLNLWSERSKKMMKEMGRYLRYIFNGHLMIVMIFIIGSVAYYYQQWVKTLDDQFPAAAIMAIIITFFLTYSPVYTFLLEADRVFLLPLERKLSSYFLKSGIVSFVLQAYILLMVLAALMPIYVQVYGSTFKVFFYFLLMILLIKAWNLALKWRIQYFVEKNVHTTDSFVRFCINVVFSYLLFVSANKILLFVLMIIMLALFSYFYKRSLDKGLKWEEIISLEQNRLTSFYRFANLFTDVPKLREIVKRRKWLDWLLSNITFNQGNTEYYLLTRTFLRAGDYLGLVIRLTILGGILIFFWDFVYGQFIFLLLFMYLTGFQLLPLKNHHQTILWMDLYPTSQLQHEKAFKKILSNILNIQGIIFGAVFFLKGEWIFGLIGIALGMIFTFLFVKFYSLKKV